MATTTTTTVTTPRAKRKKSGWIERLVLMTVLLAVNTMMGSVSFETTVSATTSRKKKKVNNTNAMMSHNQRLSLSLRVMVSSSVANHHSNDSEYARLYCNDDYDDDCWEPEDLAGAWVVWDEEEEGESKSTNSNNTNNSNRDTTNHCPGWGFGKRCDENGYAQNVQCDGPAFRDQYTWKAADYDYDDDEHPSSSLPVFDAAETCRLLGNRTVLLVGDSTQGQTASTLINRLHHHYYYRHADDGSDDDDCSGQIHFRLSDTLVKRNYGSDTMPNEDEETEEKEQQRQRRRRLVGMNRGAHWKTAVQSVDPDIVIFAVGAHIYGESRWKDLFEEVVEEMSQYQAQIRQERNRTVHFVYKTISPGGCSREISPLPPGETARTFPDYAFNHGAFYSRDLYAIQRLRRRRRPATTTTTTTTNQTMNRTRTDLVNNWPVMDLRMLYARTDAHPASSTWPSSGRRKPDCLHLCSPGPLDVVADVFQDLLAHELRE